MLLSFVILFLSSFGDVKIQLKKTALNEKAACLFKLIKVLREWD
jgi:hypothetical protein